MTERLISLLKIGADDAMARLGEPHPEATPSVLSLADLQEGRHDYQHIIVYAHTLPEMRSALEYIYAHRALSEGGAVYLLYPKLSNRIGLEGIHRDAILPYLSADEAGYPMGLPYKFNRMLSVDDTYTLIGLRHIPASQSKSKAGQPSARVADYVAYISQLSAALAPEVRQVFEGLSPGYQRGWARYVYSAKQEATQRARLERMSSLLLSGYKSIDQAPRSAK